MSKAHPDITPELRQMAQGILDGIDPLVRAAAAAAASADPPGKCQQVWCPVCALAALAAGEQHPMLEVVAQHSVTLLTAVRALLEASESAAASGASADGDDQHKHTEDVPAARPAAPRYQDIPIRVEE